MPYLKSTCISGTLTNGLINGGFIELSRQHVDFWAGTGLQLRPEPKNRERSARRTALVVVLPSESAQSLEVAQGLFCSFTVTTARRTPNAATLWALDDLLKELTRSETKGADLLERKLMKRQGIQSQQLKSTQKLDDAIRLLSLRYRGMPLSYERDVKIEAASAGFNALVVVRPTTKNGAIPAELWQRCLVTGGPSDALAVTIATITRETWAFTT